MANQPAQEIIEAVPHPDSGLTEMDIDVPGEVIYPAVWQDGQEPEPETQPDTPHDRLSPRQNEIAELLSAGKKYKEIAAELGLSLSTVRTHIHNIYLTFGVDDNAHFGPMFKTDAGCLDGKDISTLSKRERQIFDLRAGSMVGKQIGWQLGMRPSTVRTHEIHIRSKLGIKNLVELTRVAQAFRQKTTEAAQTVQPEVVAKLDQLAKAEKMGDIKLGEAGVRQVRQIRNPYLLNRLVETGYISKDMARRGSVNLPGLIAALLSNQENTENFVTDLHTEDVTREIIQQETRLFLENRR